MTNDTTPDPAYLFSAPLRDDLPNDRMQVISDVLMAGAAHVDASKHGRDELLAAALRSIIDDFEGLWLLAENIEEAHTAIETVARSHRQHAGELASQPGNGHLVETIKADAWMSASAHIDSALALAAEQTRLRREQRSTEFTNTNTSEEDTQ